MLSKQLIVNVEEGLHARPASLLVELCQKFSCCISMKKGDNVINPKSIFGVLALGAVKGDTILVNTEGPDEKEAIESIEALFLKNFKGI